MSDSDRRFEAIVQQAAVGIVVADLDGRMLEVNAAVHRMLGYPEPQLRGKTVDELTHPEDRDVGRELYAELVAGTRTSYQVKKRYLRSDGAAVWGRASATVLRREDGSPELVIGVVEDIDGQHRAEQALREAEGRYRTLVEELPLVTYIDALDERSSNIYTSPQIEPILGYSPAEWQADPDLFVKLLHDDDRERVLAEIASANERFESEYRLRARDGRWLWFRDEAVVVRDGEGTPLYSQGYLLDITARKASEDAARESETRFRRMADDAPVLVWTTDTAGNVTFFSKAWLELVGRTFDEEAGSGWVDSVHPDDAPVAVEGYREAIQAGTPWEAEYRLRRPDGTYRWIYDTGNPQLSADGELIGYVGVGIDITERREAEEALRRREAVLEAVSTMADRLLHARSWTEVDFLQPLAEALGAGRGCVYERRVDEGGEPTSYLRSEWARPGAARLGDDPALRAIPVAATSERWRDLVAHGTVINEPLSGLDAREQALLEPLGVHAMLCAPLMVGNQVQGVIAFQDLERERRWSDAEVDAVRAAAGIVGGAIQREEAVRSLRETSETLEALVETSPAAIYGADRHGNVVLWNPAAERMFGWSAEEALGRFAPFVTPETAPEYRGYLERALRGESWSNVELRRVRKDGSFVDINASSAPLRNADGEIIGLASVILDITEEKRIRDALRESQARFTAYMDNSQTVAFMKDEEGRYVYVNEPLERVFGLRPGEIIGKTDFDYVPEETAREFLQTDEVVRTTGQAVERLERAVRHNGPPLWFLSVKFPFEDSSGRRFVGGVSLDVTEREQAREALLETTRTLESLVANAPLAIVTSDREGNVSGWNPAAEGMFGWTAAEAIGGPPPHFVPGDPDGLASRTRAEAGQTVADAEAKRWRKDGSVIDVRYGKSPLRDAQGEVIGTIAMLTDVTERKRAEAELVETTQTLEAIVESSPLAILTFDHEGKVTRWNEAAERTFGWTAEEAIGRFNPLLLEGEEEEFRRAVELALAGRSWRSVEVQRRHKDGGLLDVSISSAPLRNAEGTPIGMVAVLVDVTERKRTEARLEAQHAVSGVLASAASLEEAAPQVVDAARDALAWDVGGLWLIDGDVLRPIAVRTAGSSFDQFVEASLASSLPRGVGLPGRVWASGAPTWVLDVPSETSSGRGAAAMEAGLASGLAVPVESGGELVGVFEFFACAKREPDEEMLAMLASVGRQVGEFLRRVQSDAAVREREERFRTLVSNLPGAVYRCAADEHWTMEFLSDAIVDICGFPASDFIGSAVRTYASVIHDDDRDKVLRIVGEAIERAGPYELEYRVVHADGSIRWVSEKGQPMLAPDGQVAWLDGALFDVTEARRAQDELARANAFLDSVVESLPTPLFLKEAQDLRFARINRAAEELFGIPREELLGKNDLDFFPAEQAEFYMGVDRDVLARQELLDIPEEPIETRDHGLRYLHTRKVPIVGEDGRSEYVLALSVDITEQKLATMERERLLAAEQAALEQAEAARELLAAQNQALLELDRMKDEFVALVSHELRTPLTSILGYLELIIEGDAGDVTEDQAHFLAIVERNAQRLLRLVGDLLFVAQIEAGKLAIERDGVDLLALVQDCLEAARPRAAEKQIELELEGKPAPELVGDRIRLAQLLDNLVSNAIKFTPQGGRVQIRMAAGEGRVMLSVSDTGIGIPLAEQHQLFERFFRSTSATAGAIQGTGLGLTITKAIVDAHGGSIAVESEEGRGTTFVVDLPLASDPGSTSSPSEPMQMEGGSLR